MLVPCVYINWCTKQSSVKIIVHIYTRGAQNSIGLARSYVGKSLGGYGPCLLSCVTPPPQKKVSLFSSFDCIFLLFICLMFLFSPKVIRAFRAPKSFFDSLSAISRVSFDSEVGFDIT